MNVDDLVSKDFATPLTSPTFPMGSYRFVEREFFTITYRTDPDKLCAVVPERAPANLRSPAAPGRQYCYSCPALNPYPIQSQSQRRRTS